jgi:hypothetical protein
VFKKLEPKHRSKDLESPKRCDDARIFTASLKHGIRIGVVNSTYVRSIWQLAYLRLGRRSLYGKSEREMAVGLKKTAIIRLRVGRQTLCRLRLNAFRRFREQTLDLPKLRVRLWRRRQQDLELALLLLGRGNSRNLEVHAECVLDVRRITW